jgi:predicted cytidylate kinase
MREPDANQARTQRFYSATAIIHVIITISGLPGSGKSTLAKNLAKALGFRRYSVGDLRGRMAMERGMTIDELNEIGYKEEWVHKEADAYQARLGKNEENFTIDSWLGFHFIPHSVKIFLEVDPEVGARRVFRDQRPDEKPAESVAETRSMLENRMVTMDEQYKKYYGIDFRKRDNYDLAFDTTNLTREETLQKALEFIKRVHPREYRKALESKTERKTTSGSKTD